MNNWGMLAVFLINICKFTVDIGIYPINIDFDKFGT